VLAGGDGNDHLWGGAAWDYLHGDAGFDYVRYDFAPDRVDVRLQHPFITGTGGGWAGEALGDSYFDVEGVVGSNFDDHIEGNDPDLSRGVSGGNVLIGLDGNDEIFGLAGEDTLWGGNGADLLDGGAGFDFARYDDSPEAVYVNLQVGFGYTGAALNDQLISIEGLWGSSFGDTLIGDAAENTFYGGDGDDLLIGGMGGDRLSGDAGFDTVSYAGAASSVAVNLTTGGTIGDAFGDTFFSVEGVIGSNFADTLVGNSDDNMLRGGAGGDTLTGGAGNDRFVFTRADLLAERDIVTDFGTAAGNIDTLVFRDLAAGDIALTDDPAGGVRISVLDPAYGGDIIVLGVTSAQLSGHLTFM
jgi:Ca2+-binding RTX toxin-like protein